VRCGTIQNLGWGLLTRVALPGGGKVGVYQPRHARPESVRPQKAKKARSARKRASA
jgi:hypothetical protein